MVGKTSCYAPEGLAPIIVRETGRVLGQLKRAGLSILLVEQNVPLALTVADRVYVMNKGRRHDKSCDPLERPSNWRSVGAAPPRPELIAENAGHALVPAPRGVLRADPTGPFAVHFAG
jgi:energy-coupling factor transporter ATP-binding protein EcfA2